VAQADGLAGVLEQKGFEIRGVMNLVVKREVLIERITARRVCERCGATFNVRTLPPPPEGDCADPAEACGGEHVIQRDDDRPETVERRLDVYEASTAPLKAYYQDRDLLFDVDGQGTPEQVFERLRVAVA
jgi:adenylate kinase